MESMLLCCLLYMMSAVYKRRLETSLRSPGFERDCEFHSTQGYVDVANSEVHFVDAM